MEYKEFLDSISEKVKEHFEQKGLDRNVAVRKIIKNNDIELDALTIMESKSNISPTIYLNKYYDKFMHGEEIDNIVKEIYELYTQHNGVLDFKVEMFRDFSYMKDKIVYKLINAEYNKKLLQDIPHFKVLDLAVVFYCLINNDWSGSATALIHNSHMDMWEVTKEDLYELATVNTPKILPPEIRSMEDIVRDMIVDDIEKDMEAKGILRDGYESEYGSLEDIANMVMEEMDELKNDICMFVLTNHTRLNGAACILYDNLLLDFANKNNSDIYVIPSSVHEVILVPAGKYIESEDINSMIKEVNNTGVEEGDILSDHVYFFNRETGILE
ncbi:MAG: DUF5688 family protein [Eubacterium sp.]